MNSLIQLGDLLFFMNISTANMSQMVTDKSNIQPSKTASGAGTAFLVKESATILNSTAHSYSSFEYSSITLKITKTLLTIFNIYRPPPSSSHSQPFSTFLNQFSSFLSSAATTLHDFIIAGDFNIHVDDPLDSQSIQFSSGFDCWTSTVFRLHRRHVGNH